MIRARLGPLRVHDAWRWSGRPLVDDSRAHKKLLKFMLLRDADDVTRLGMFQRKTDFA